MYSVLVMNCMYYYYYIICFFFKKKLKVAVLALRYNNTRIPKLNWNSIDYWRK